MPNNWAQHTSNPPLWTLETFAKIQGVFLNAKNQTLVEQFVETSINRPVSGWAFAHAGTQLCQGIVAGPGGRGVRAMPTGDNQITLKLRMFKLNLRLPEIRFPKLKLPRSNFQNLNFKDAGVRHQRRSRRFRRCSARRWRSSDTVLGRQVGGKWEIRPGEAAG